MKYRLRITPLSRIVEDIETENNTFDASGDLEKYLLNFITKRYKQSGGKAIDLTSERVLDELNGAFVYGEGKGEVFKAALRLVARGLIYVSDRGSRLLVRPR